MYVLELLAGDAYAVLGRLLDHARVADLKLATVSASRSAGQYAIRATIEARDTESVDKLACKVRQMVGVAEVVVRKDPSIQDQSREAEILLVS